MKIGGGRVRRRGCRRTGTVLTEIREDGYGGGGDAGRLTEGMWDDGDSSFWDDQPRWE